MQPPKRKKIRRPKSWATMDRLGTFPVPFIAPRYAGGTIAIAKADPERVRDVYEKEQCSLCGQKLGEPPNVLCSREELAVGVAHEGLEPTFVSPGAI